MNGHRRLGFTLIELLVVIAIIAILAAILFPVFAQAKTAAKKTQAVSDIKQVTLATLMYAGDYDDVNVPRLRVGYGPAQGGGDPEVVMSWDKLVMPYTKNYQLVMSSMDPRTKYQSPYGMVRRSYAVAGNSFKGIQLNPSFGWGSWPNAVSVSTTSMPLPAETVALGERRQLDRNTPNMWGHSDWHHEAYMNNSRSADMPAGNKILPEWGQIANKYNGGSVWSFMDGHAKYHKINGKTRDGATNGTLFKGYEQRLYSGWGSDPDWDWGVSCFDAEWDATRSANDCKLPGE